LGSGWKCRSVWWSTDSYTYTNSDADPDTGAGADANSNSIADRRVAE